MILHSKKGFTLLEVLISLAILAFIGVGIYRMTTNTFRLRDSLTEDAQFFNRTRLALSLLERDLSQLYTPVPWVNLWKSLSSNPANQNQDSAQGGFPTQTQATDSANITTHWGAEIHPSGIRVSRFKGSESEIHFISSSHVRIYKEKKESVFIRVSYVLEDTPNSNLKKLVRKVSTQAFRMDDEDEEFRNYVILTGIKTFKFRFLKKILLPGAQNGEMKDQWYPTWDNTEQDYLNIYPDRIEVSFDVREGENLSFEGKLELKPEMMPDGIPKTF